MFAFNSRYAGQATYTVTLPGGTQVTAVITPLPQAAPLAGYASPPSGERLDLVAVQYLNASSGFWRLCDANNAMLAGSLAARPLIGIPAGGTA